MQENNHNIISRTKFCHYTTIDNARNILSSESFFLSKYNRMNDLAEAGLHSNDKDRVFVLCFSNSESFNIPVFYLYGGIDGKGCRIQFTDAKIRDLINKCQIRFVNNSYRVLKREVPSDSYSIFGDWVYYVTNDGFCEHKIDKINRYNNKEAALKELAKDNRQYFVKSPIWKYESEFRIVVVFKEKVEYDKIALSFDIKENEKGISMVCGPETSEKEYKEIRKEFGDYGISKCSRYPEGIVSMDLVERNKDLLKAGANK